MPFSIWTLTIELVLIYMYCVFVYVLSVIILCADNGDVRTIMLQALDLGLLNGEYVFISIGATPGKNYMITLHYFTSR